MPASRGRCEFVFGGGFTRAHWKSLRLGAVRAAHRVGRPLRPMRRFSGVRAKSVTGAAYAPIGKILKLAMSHEAVLGLLLTVVPFGCTNGELPPRPPGHPADPNGESTPLEPTSAEAAPSSDSPTAPSAGALYACPMHPEVTSPVPSSCPKCGMNLGKRP